MSQGDPRLHFGLGKATVADSIEIRWPDGTVDRFEQVKANQILKLTHKATTNGAQR
jgi:hypothetical protein